MPPAEPAAGRGRVAGWLDVSAGVSGDMLLGAVVAAGADLVEIQSLVDTVIPGTVRLDRREVTRAGLRATKVDVVPLVDDQPHRTWAQIREVLSGTNSASTRGLPEPVRRNAVRVFERLAIVEGAVHGVAVDDVEFHEVGSWDSVADVVGTCAGLHLLGVGDLVAGSVALGSGTVPTAHGELPVPVPAVLRLVEGWTVSAGGGGELATPTGAALLTTLAREGAGLPSMRVSGAGVGAGTRDTPRRPNVVRLVLGEAVGEPDDQVGGDPVDGVVDEVVEQPSDPAGRHTDMVVLEANVDDLDPRVWPTVLAALLERGAADAWLVPILMKKGRPAHTLTALCAPGQAHGLRELVLDLTTTLGVRQSAVRRWALDRGWADVDVGGVAVAVKVAHRDGWVVHATPEFDDVVAAAAALARPVRDILTDAIAAAAGAGLGRGRPVPSLRSGVER